MGERGLISRILCAKFGGYLTFGTLESRVVSAPGQPTIKDLLNLYNFRQIGPDTKVFGIIGKPVGHSKSPLLYNEAFKSVGFNGVYVHLLVDDIADFLHTYSSTDFSGFRFTSSFLFFLFSFPPFNVLLYQEKKVLYIIKTICSNTRLSSTFFPELNILMAH